jgi:serine/threonine protein kinase/formylglycine-generating enzyme required for sulfatase activity
MKVPSPSDPNSDLGFGATFRVFDAGRRLFDRYELKEILGVGGMGMVWRAFDEQLERDVALKFLPEQVAMDEQAIKDLKRETKKSQELRHHHIVQVYDFIPDKRNACISMEYIDGPTLSSLKARKEEGFFEVDEIRGWVEQLCEALVYAHERARVVHRDLKPANLMINGKGELKITDFGIARSVSDSMSMLSQARNTSGTLVYMSPQQLGGQQASHLDDIYSVGATIYELLASKPPFYSGDVTDQIKHVTPTSMQKRRDDLQISGSRIPKQWEETIAVCLAKDPGLRPQSAGEVAKRLGLSAPWYQAPASIPVPKRPPPMKRSGPTFSRQLEMLLANAKTRFKHFVDSAGSHFSKVDWVNSVSRLKAAIRSRTVRYIWRGLALAVVIIGAWIFWQIEVRQQAERRRPAEEAGIAPQRSEEPTKLQAERQAREEQEREEANRQAKFADQQRVERQRKEKEETDQKAKTAEKERVEREKKAKEMAESLKALPAASKEQPYDNSLAMKFVPVPHTGVLFSIWETRVRDFEAFMEASGHKATGGMYSLEKEGWKQAGKTWKNLGFDQTEEHPVCGVSWEDATAFCEWLTEKERTAGKITASQRYRLPTDLEWSAAVGLEEESGSTPDERDRKVKGIYPWGTKWPPPAGAGNYAGSEARTGGWPSDWDTIKGYRDEYPRTAPVGSFSANENGIYDLGGNVWEWCEDLYEGKIWRVLRGASWYNTDPDYLLSSCRRSAAPQDDLTGFRCVLAVESSRKAGLR